MGEVVALRQGIVLPPSAQEQAPYFGVFIAPGYELAKGAAVRGEEVKILSQTHEGLTFPEPSLVLRGYGYALMQYRSHTDETPWPTLVITLEKHPQYTYPKTGRVVVIRHALVLYGPCQLEPIRWTFDERLKFT